MSFWAVKKFFNSVTSLWPIVKWQNAGPGPDSGPGQVMMEQLYSDCKKEMAALSLSHFLTLSHPLRFSHKLYSL